MYYFDTSFLTPLIREEESSSHVARFMAGLPAGELAISRWTQVEFASLLARAVRMRVIRGEQALAAEALFEEVVGESFIVLLPDAEDYDLARRYLQRYGSDLRVGDALHLAVAANYRVEAVYSLDQAMVDAGRVLGLPVRVGIGEK